MKVHIFNPGVELAHSAYPKIVTLPHVVRQMGADLSYLPALWAEDGDVVIVANKTLARRRLAHFHTRGKKVYLIEPSEIYRVESLADGVEPWGWDQNLAAWLSRNGDLSKFIPQKEQMTAWHALMSRVTAKRMLDIMMPDHHVETENDKALPRLKACLSREPVVVKAPWSSSGRGIRFLKDSLMENERQWCRRVIERQGSLMIEPYYNKVKDFAMEFTFDGSESTYLGLSLFRTRRCRYAGNIIADEDTKETMLERYVGADRLRDIRETLMRLLRRVLRDAGYYGCYGVDMMITRGKNDFTVHPCVEINFRRTMGHVALILARDERLWGKTMRLRQRNTGWKMEIRR